ncbi:MAG: hypothetical protein IPJ94_16750 [Chloroflexi bacterium]|nr:hypothetical protein [Chloroflexota bacterium]
MPSARLAASKPSVELASALPTITDPVTIDGWSQGGAGYTGPPLIELNGALAGSSVKGLHITAGNSVARGLVINGFTGSPLAASTCTAAAATGSTAITSALTLSVKRASPTSAASGSKAVPAATASAQTPTA